MAVSSSFLLYPSLIEFLVYGSFSFFLHVVRLIVLPAIILSLLYHSLFLPSLLFCLALLLFFPSLFIHPHRNFGKETVGGRENSCNNLHQHLTHYCMAHISHSVSISYMFWGLPLGYWSGSPNTDIGTITCTLATSFFL